MPTWRGAYSSDDDFENFTRGMSRDASYPGPKPNVYVEGPPCKGIDANGVPFGAIDCSGTIDPQTPDRQGFDDGKDKGRYLALNRTMALRALAGTCFLAAEPITNPHVLA